MADRLEYEVEGQIGATDSFARGQPAEFEGPGEAWATARLVVDHGCFVLLTVNQIREATKTSDMVTAALLRRALVTTETIRSLLAGGLEEPAYATFRTLLEIECNLRLVTSDQTERMARKLAAFHHLKGQRLFTSQLKSPSMRGVIQGHPEHFAWTLETSRRLKGFVKSYDDVREELEASQHWHGLPNIESAFETAGLGNDYLSLYGLWSPFVHAGNPEHDFSDIVNGRPHLRALVQRDPKHTLNTLFGALIKTLDIVDLYLAGRGNPHYQPELTVRPSEGDPFPIPATTALRVRALDVFEEYLPLPPEDSGGGSA